MDKKNNDGKKREKKIKVLTLTYAIIAIIIFAFFLGALFIYRFNESRKIPDYAYNQVFLPAIIIEGFNFISIGSINENLVSIRKFYESQNFSSLGLRFDFTTEDGKKRLKIREKELINKMIEDRAIEILAKERDIRISKKTVSENVERKFEEYGNKNSIRENLHNLYGWTIEDFEDKVVKPSLYKDALEKWLAENDGKEQNEKAKKDADDALVRIKNGENFEKIAKDISEGGTANLGGKLGWFKEEHISSELKDSVLALKVGGVSDVLESKFGYHVIKKDNENDIGDGKTYEISQIFFPKFSFADWLENKIKEKDILVLLSEYDWNDETGMVIFKDKKMEEFEQESLNKAEKDASLMAL